MVKTPVATGVRAATPLPGGSVDLGSSLPSPFQDIRVRSNKTPFTTVLSVGWKNLRAENVCH